MFYFAVLYGIPHRCNVQLRNEGSAGAERLVVPHVLLHIAGFICRAGGGKARTVQGDS